MAIFTEAGMKKYESWTHIVVVTTAGVNYRQSFRIALRPTILNLGKYNSHPGEWAVVCVFWLVFIVFVTHKNIAIVFCVETLLFLLLLLILLRFYRIVKNPWVTCFSVRSCEIVRNSIPPGTHKNIGCLWPNRKDFPEEAGVKINFSTYP